MHLFYWRSPVSVHPLIRRWRNTYSAPCSDRRELRVHLRRVLNIPRRVVAQFSLWSGMTVTHLNVPSVAILPEPDRPYDADYCLDHTRMTRPEKRAICFSFKGEWSNSLTQVGIHLACSLPKPFLACAFKRSSWFCRSFTMRISKHQKKNRLTT